MPPARGMREERRGRRAGEALRMLDGACGEERKPGEKPKQGFPAAGMIRELDSRES